jgi:RHS repeat-associated protein
MYAVYNYDDASRLTNIVNAADSSQISFGYDNADRVTSRSYPNGVNTTYEYDGMSRLKRLKDVSSTATLFDRQYGYNNASQINQIIEPTQTRSFGYDLVNRLTNVTNPGGTNESYNFDDVGNRTSSHRSASYGYQPFNKVVSTATANYVYDANGNMVSKAEGTNFWRYGYDYENRLVSASTRKQTVRYRYDALGRRVQRYTVGTKENTKFIYDGQDVLVDDNSGTLTKYINGEGIDNKLRVQTGSNVNYFLADHLGSTNGLADASGNLTASTNYDSFGNASNANFPTRYQFTGREYDSFTGLQYSRARWYDANLGRFISEDPIGFRGGDINLYGYVWNSPNSFTDPMGLDGWGNDTADWLDNGISNIGQGIGFDPPVMWNPISGPTTIGDLSHGTADLLRVGSGTGHAIYDEDDNGWGRAANVAMDISRASSIFAILAGPGARLASKGACPTQGRFPKNPDKLLPELPRDVKGRIYPSDYIRIRPEQHPLKPGETYSPRHHGQHYHVEQRTDAGKSWNNSKNVNKVKPKNYKKGEGTGFLPGEEFP